MKILHSTITYPPAIGGLDLCVQQTAESLAFRGHEVTVATTDLEQPLSRRPVKIPPGWTDAVEVRRFAARRLPGIPYPFSGNMRVLLKETRPDLFHAWCVWHHPAYLAWRASRKQGKPLVLHSIFSPRNGRLWTFYWRFVDTMVREAACVIAISEFERQLVLQAGLRPRRIEVVAPAMDLSVLELPAPAPEVAKGRRFVFSVGRLAFGKRVDRLIDALPSLLPRHSGLHLVIAGPDYGDEGRLRTLVAQRALDRHVTFTGVLSRHELAGYLQHSALFAMTTDFELFGIVLAEAMAAGSPVVAPRSTSVPYVVRDGVTGLLYETDSVDDLSRKIDQVLTDDRLRHSLIEAGRIEARTRFSLQAGIDRIEAIYRDCAEEP